jgi:tRNA G18 (ribose-2'-O)-methylase SpoU
MPSEITITDQDGKLVLSVSIPEVDNFVSYSASAIGEGRLVYGHFGRWSDFTDLKRLFGLQFNDSVVVIKVNQKHDAGSMVRNAQMFGAKAVILFPDPFPYTLSNNNSKVIIMNVKNKKTFGTKK